MTKEFLPYDRALKLKQLGFEEPSLDFYDDNQELFYNHENKEKIHIGDSVKAPIFQQAFRWFREEYKIDSHVDRGFKDEYYYTILENRKYRPINGFYNNSYEEAELACLDKLIEIIELKQQEQ
jgi:hypothetical protein